MSFIANIRQAFERFDMSILGNTVRLFQFEDRIPLAHVHADSVSGERGTHGDHEPTQDTVRRDEPLEGFAGLQEFNGLGVRYMDVVHGLLSFPGWRAARLGPPLAVYCIDVFEMYRGDMPHESTIVTRGNDVFVALGRQRFVDWHEGERWAVGP